MSEIDHPIDSARRRLLLLGTLGAASLPIGTTEAATSARRPIKAIAFDGFSIFSPAGVFAATKAAFPESEAAIWQNWFQKIFTDTWLRTTARRYRPFIDVAAESMDYVCKGAKLPLAADARDQILTAFSNLGVWPDVKEQLAWLKAHGVRLALLSNMSEAMLRANMRRNGLDGNFEAVLSTDRVRAFKPAPEAYAIGTHAFGLPKNEIGFAPFAAWDAAGASWFGYPTAWVNRQNQQAEPGAPDVLTGRDLSVVAKLVSSLA